LVRKAHGKHGLKSPALVRDAEATRAHILDAAEEEFAANGLAGARTEAIAAKTKVTKAMIYYYFESKEKLYLSVLERAFVQRFQMAQAMKLESLPADQALERFIREFLDYTVKHRHQFPIFIHEAMQNKGKYYSKLGALSLYGVVMGILERGMAEGFFRRLDPFHTAVHIFGSCVFYFVSRENIKSLVPNKNLLGPQMLKGHIDGAVEFIMRGVRN